MPEEQIDTAYEILERMLKQCRRNSLLAMLFFVFVLLVDSVGEPVAPLCWIGFGSFFISFVIDQYFLWDIRRNKMTGEDK